MALVLFDAFDNPQPQPLADWPAQPGNFKAKASPLTLREDSVSSLQFATAMSSIVRSFLQPRHGQRPFINFFCHNPPSRLPRQFFNSTRILAIKKPDPPATANPKNGDVKGTEDLKPSSTVAHEDANQAPEHAKEQEKSDTPATETVEPTKGRIGRKKTRSATSAAHSRYKPVIPDGFLATNYLRHASNKVSLEQIPYSVPQSIIDEILYIVHAGLVPLSPTVDSMPAKHQNLLINIPVAGATLLQDHLVRGVAREVNADLLVFDAQDLMTMSANIFSSKAKVNPWPLFARFRGFNPQPSTPLSVASAFMGSMDNDYAIGDEDEFTDEDEDEDAGSHSKKEAERLLSRNGQRTTDKISSKFDRFFATLLSAAPKGNTSASSSPLSATKIVYFRDLIDVGNSSFGAMIMSSLIEAVQTKRRKGHRIMIIAGFSPSLVRSSFGPTTSVDGIDTADSTTTTPTVNAVDILTTISLPSFNVVTIPPPTNPPTPTQLVGDWTQSLHRDRRLRTLEINIANIRATCANKGAELVEEATRNGAEDGALARLVGIQDEVWGFHRVHQLVINAVGYAMGARGVQATGKVRLAGEHFTHAEQVVQANEAMRQQAAKVLQDQERERAAKTGNGRGVWAKRKIETLEEECDQYEKRLLRCVVNPAHMHASFKDVRAPTTTIETLQTLITLPLLKPELFSYGVLKRHFISGLLLFGPPGTGKTMLAKAVAKESGSQMLEIKASDVFDMYVGEGEKNVKAIFSLARKLSPCVVFIDEVDSMFNARRNDSSSNAHREIINQFMVEWDGLTSDNKGVLLMAATNRPFDLDDAVLRRMPRRMLVDLPNETDRHHILSIHLREEQLDSTISLSDLARTTAYFSGSDLKNLCVSAALAAVQEENAGIMSSAADAAELPLPLPASHEVPVRVLKPHHFAKALSQVTPSCSDDMQTLVDIRKWDALYGDGAKERNKRPMIGFGLGDIVKTVHINEIARSV